MNHFKVAVVGATGLVGQAMVKILEERKFPAGELTPVASSRSAGGALTFSGKEWEILPLTPKVFRGVRIALFSAGADISREFAPVAVKAGAVVIDNSSAWRMEANVPLVVPEVNPETLRQHQGIVANPNCSTIQMVVALHPLHLRFKLRRVVVTTFQAVTGSGKKGVVQLRAEIQQATPRETAYPHQIAYNCLPHIGRFLPDGYSEEEQKMIRETAKIMGDEQIKVTATTVRVPVYGGHSEALNLSFEQPFTLEEVRQVLGDAPGVTLLDDPQKNIYPLPVGAEGKDDVFVGRIRRDETIPNGLNMWVVSDNLRKGAATNSIQIAENLIQMNLINGPA